MGSFEREELISQHVLIVQTGHKRGHSPHPVQNPLNSSCQLHRSCINGKPWVVFNSSKKVEQQIACVPAALGDHLQTQTLALTLHQRNRYRSCQINKLLFAYASFLLMGRAGLTSLLF